MDKILLCLNHLGGREQDYVMEAIRGNWVVPLGPDVDAFESGLKDFLTGHSRTPEAIHAGLSKEILALSSGTAAVHLALIGAGVGSGDEVICQSFTFCASANPIIYQGAVPVFVDSEEDSWNMDPDLLEKAILDRQAVTGRKPAAIIVVDLYGMPARLDRISEIATAYGIPLIEDAAEAFGSEYDGKPCSLFGDYGVMSFNGNKMITTSGGGALVCPGKESRDSMMFYATQAREGYPYYQHEHIGYNYRLSNISAAIGRGQLEVADAHIDHHRRLHRLYCRLFSAMDGIRVHDNPTPMSDSNFWLTTVLIEPGYRVDGQEQAYAHAVEGAVGGAAGKTHRARVTETDCQPDSVVEALRLLLQKEGIETRPLWKPLHRQPVFSGCAAYVNGVSERLFRRGLCLPSGPWVTEDHVRRIVGLIADNLKPSC